MDYRSSILPQQPSGYPASNPGVPCFDSSLGERARQIKTLRVFNENVSELRSNAQYRVDFEGQGGVALALILNLGPYFPREPPEIYLSPVPQHHPWTDPSGRVIAAPGLMAYNARHTDLGRLVGAIKRQFQLTPVLTSSSNGLSTPSPPYPHPQGLLPPSQPLEDNKINHSPPSLSFPELSGLSNERLQELSSDPESLATFLKTESPTVAHYLSAHKSERDSLRGEIETASETLSGLSEELQGLSQTLASRESTWESLKSELISSTEAYVSAKGSTEECLRHACDKFRRSAAEREESSDKLAESFLDGESEGGVEGFLKDYFALRKEYHLRKAQGEKLSEVLRRRKSHF
eukprot:TRINITY_DN1562_c0_g1_i1.p1 TRINITY_DN1562_c0_g1~~TRINITY_DN1562_c0_g1_i1.p1  ORF type:complete len:349 (+),score=119.36 TRINITY_DN1562_c0_g1_i1:32-1078(+)